MLRGEPQNAGDDLPRGLMPHVEIHNHPVCPLPHAAEYSIIWYNFGVSGNYTIATELTGEAKVLAEAAKAASREAVAQAFAAGLSIVVAKGGKLVRIAPDGTETVLEDA